MALPPFIPPMLASIGDGIPEHGFLFEIKWDGTRTIAYREEGGYRAHNRKGSPLEDRYPELDRLVGLPPGTVVDGEVVVLVDQKPNFAAFLSREQARTRARALVLARSLPAVYVVFDLLYQAYEPTLDLPLVERRDRLGRLLSDCELPGVLFSEAVASGGAEFLAAASDQGFEGIVAKRATSTYQPGKRPDTWLKFKRAQEVLCVIIGYVPGDQTDIRSLVVAADFEGRLESLGRVGSGLTEDVRRKLGRILPALVQAEPLVTSRLDAVWVRPEVFCRVKYLERTASGDMRAPVFLGLVDGA